VWQAVKEYEELTKKYENLTTKNDQLSEECQHYVERFKRMEETIKNLRREIDERNRLASLLISIPQHCFLTIVFLSTAQHSINYYYYFFLIPQVVKIPGVKNYKS